MSPGSAPEPSVHGAVNAETDINDVLGSATDDDIATGRQWLGSMKWIHAVEVLTMPTGTSAVVCGVGNRTPIRRRIPLSAARGLVALGVPQIRLPTPVR
ncbi:MAG: hypothetical protein AAGF73_10270 [Actinomycetota bacterium]